MSLNSGGFGPLSSGGADLSVVLRRFSGGSESGSGVTWSLSLRRLFRGIFERLAAILKAVMSRWRR